MATPSNSAYHRRRALAQPSSQITSVTHTHPLPSRPPLPRSRPPLSRSSSTSSPTLSLPPFPVSSSLLLSLPLPLLLWIISQFFHPQPPSFFHPLSFFSLILSTFTISLSHSLLNPGPPPLLHLCITISFLPILSLFLLPLLFGPSLHPSPVSTILPPRSSLPLPVLLSTLSALLHSLFNHLAPSPSLYPFHAPLSTRLLHFLPIALVHAALPPFLAFVPSFLLHLILSDAPNSFLHRLLGALAASLAVFFALFFWEILSLYETQVKRQGGITQNRPLADLSNERERYELLLRKAAGGDVSVVEEVVGCVYVLTGREEDMKQFVVFADASGEMWRWTVECCLRPLEKLEGVLRERNLRRVQEGGGPRRGFWGGDGQKVSNVEVCVVACEVLKRVLRKGVTLDCYGGVQRGLGRVMMGLLACREQTERFLGMGGGGGDEQKVMLVDEAVVLAVYGIVEVYRDELVRFVEGGEVGWDHSLDRQLRVFLLFKA